MRVVVVGGGISGAAISRAVEARGCSVTELSRSTGFDVLRDDAIAAFDGADVIVEATGQFTTSRKAATQFFTGSTRAIARAADAVGAHHVLLSIINCMRPEVQGYGYFAGKTAQEAVARSVSPRLTIVRSTQWFEFARQNLERMRFGPIALVPGMTIAPVALDAVAAVIAAVVVGERSAREVEVAGPNTTTLWNMTKALPEPGAIPVLLPIPGRMGRAFRAGALLPGRDTEVVGPGFREWLPG
ncbi:NADH(P)-binding protein [Curtobacterium sp. MCPF17_046]|nr:NADH(P)-binding protein [Curtobacterium sp. MCPF17_046]